MPRESALSPPPLGPALSPTHISPASTTPPCVGRPSNAAKRVTTPTSRSRLLPRTGRSSPESQLELPSASARAAPRALARRRTTSPGPAASEVKSEASDRRDELSWPPFYQPPTGI